MKKLRLIKKIAEDENKINEMREALEKEDVQKIVDLIDQGFDKNFQDPQNNNNSIFHTIIKTFKSETNAIDVLQKIRLKGLNRSLQDNDGNTILHVAAQRGNENIFMQASFLSADLIGTENLNKETPLHVLAKNKHYEMVMNFIQHVPELIVEQCSLKTNDGETLYTLSNKKTRELLNELLGSEVNFKKQEDEKKKTIRLKQKELKQQKKNKKEETNSQEITIEETNPTITEEKTIEIDDETTENTIEQNKQDNEKIQKRIEQKTNEIKIRISQIFKNLAKKVNDEITKGEELPEDTIKKEIEKLENKLTSDSKYETIKNILPSKESLEEQFFTYMNSPQTFEFDFNFIPRGQFFNNISQTNEKKLKSMQQQIFDNFKSLLSKHKKNNLTDENIQQEISKIYQKISKDKKFESISNVIPNENNLLIYFENFADNPQSFTLDLSSAPIKRLSPKTKQEIVFNDEIAKELLHKYYDDGVVKDLKSKDKNLFKWIKNNKEDIQKYIESIPFDETRSFMYEDFFGFFDTQQFENNKENYLEDLSENHKKTYKKFEETLNNQANIAVTKHAIERYYQRNMGKVEGVDYYWKKVKNPKNGDDVDRIFLMNTDPHQELIYSPLAHEISLKIKEDILKGDLYNQANNYKKNQSFEQIYANKDNVFYSLALQKDQSVSVLTAMIPLENKPLHVPYGIIPSEPFLPEPTYKKNVDYINISEQNKKVLIKNLLRIKLGISNVIRDILDSKVLKETNNVQETKNNININENVIKYSTTYITHDYALPNYQTNKVCYMFFEEEWKEVNKLQKELFYTYDLKQEDREEKIKYLMKNLLDTMQSMEQKVNNMISELKTQVTAKSRLKKLIYYSLAK